MLRIILFAVCANLLLTACVEEVDQDAVDKERIENFLSDNNLTAQEHPSGLYYIIEEMGAGGSPAIEDSVQVRYAGYLLDGTVFDATPDSSTVTFPLANLIECWQIGIPLIEKGGSITLLSPSGLAYGDRGPLANEVLRFEVELVNWW